MENNIVHVLISGESYEGFSIVGIFKSKEAAVARAEQLIVEESDGYSYRPEPVGPKGELSWVDGPSYIEIQEYTLGA